MGRDQSNFEKGKKKNKKKMDEKKIQDPSG